MKRELAAAFSIKDLGESTHFLGMEVHQTSSGISLTQRNSITDLAELYGQTNALPCATPLPAGTVLKPAGEGCEEDPDIPLAAVVGSLNHIAQSTRPDIAFAVGAIARHAAHPNRSHWNAAMHLVRYLLSTKDTGLTYVRAPSPTVLFSAEGFCDSDYAGDVESRRSTTGYIFTAVGGAISWSSRIQPTVATSTMEAEYMSAASAAKEALWIRKLLAELGCSQPCVQIGCDN